jgi:hypothetical protein
MRPRWNGLVLVLALVAVDARLVAQSLTARAAAGVAVPVGTAGGAGERYRPGPAAEIAVETPLSVGASGRGSLRVGATWVRLPGRVIAGPSGAGARYADLGMLGGSLDLVVARTGGAAEPYLVAGLGAYRLQKRGERRNPYGTTAALQAGVGVDLRPRSRIGPFVEARLVLHVTDYASAAEFVPTVHAPVRVGVRIR